MILRYIGPDGSEVSLETEPQLREAIAKGALTGQTMVQVDGDPSWKPAEAVPQFQLIMGELAGAGAGPCAQPPLGANANPQPAKAFPYQLTGWGLVAFAAIIFLAVNYLTGNRSSWSMGAATGAVLGVFVRDLLVLFAVRAVATKLWPKVRPTATIGRTWVVIGIFVLGELLIRGGVVVYEASYATRAISDVQQVVEETLNTGQATTAVGTWMTDFVVRSQQIQTDFQAALVDHGILNILGVETFQTEDSIAAAQKNVADLTPEIAGFLDRFERLINGAPADIQNMNVPDDFKQGLLEGYNSTKEASLAGIRKFFGVEQDLLTEIDATLSFMQQALARNGYTIENGLINFTSQTYLDEYNSHISAIQALAQEEQRVQAAMVQELQSRMEELKSVTGK